MEGVQLILAHPQVATRSCEDCQAWVYNEKTGQREIVGRNESRRYLPRVPGMAPCRLKGMGCAKGTPENPKGLNDANLAAYEHYRECRAVGQWPDDPIVRRNAALIRDVEDDRAAVKRLEFEAKLLKISVTR